MPLVNLKEILSSTRAGKYAVGSFNINGYEDAQGFVNGAVKARSPLILMVSVSNIRAYGALVMAGMVRGMAAMADVPVCLHLDHATDLDMIKECVDHGFSSVMIDASDKPYEENIALSKEIAIYAHAHGCSVEAELGRIGGREDNISVDDSSSAFTNPADVPRFVEETKIDALAMAVGTVHGYYKSAPNIDFSRIETTATLTDCPLVLHGGTGVSVADFQRAIRCGISKINVGTELKKTLSDAIRAAVAAKPDTEDPRNYIFPARDACAQAILKKMEIFSSAGRV